MQEKSILEGGPQAPLAEGDIRKATVEVEATPSEEVEAPPEEAPPPEEVEEVLSAEEERPGLLGRARARLRRRPEEEKPVLRTEVRRYEVEEGGPVGEKVKLTYDQELKLCDRLVILAQNARDLREVRDVRPEELSALENILYERKTWIEEIGKKVEEGQRLEDALKDEADLKEFLGLAYYAVIDEIFEKAFQSGKILKDNPERLRVLLEHTRLGRLINWINKMPEKTLEDTIARLSSHYTREVRFAKRTDKEILADFQELESLYRGLQESFFGPDAPEASIWELLTATPASIADNPRDKLGNYLYQRLSGDSGILTLDYDGLSIAELWEKDPDAAARVLLEAKDRAMTDWISKLSKNTLEKRYERELGEQTTVIKQAKLRSEKLKEPAEQERTVTQEKVDEVKATYEEQKAIVDKLRADLEEKEKQLADAQKKKRAVDVKVGTADHPGSIITDLDRQIESWQRRIDDISPRIAQLNQEIRQHNQDLQTATGSQAKDIERQRNAKEQHVTRLERARDAYEADKKGYEDKKHKLLEAQVDATIEFEELTEEVNDLRVRLKGREEIPATATEPVKEAVEGEQEKLKRLEALYKTLQKTFDEEGKRIAEKKPTPANEHLARGIDKWVDVAINDYLTILERIFGPDIRAADLANISIDPVTGKVRGAEALRELIFNASTKKEFLYDPELAREMLSDFTIAKALISYLNIDPEREVTIRTDTFTIRELMKRLEGPGGIAVQLAQARLANDPRRVDICQRGLARIVNPLLQEVLQDVRKMSKGEIGDFTQRIIKRGVKMAALGTPFAEAPFEARQAPFRVCLESLTHRGYGEARFRGPNKVIYESKRMERTYEDDAGVTHTIGHWSVKIGISRTDDGRLMATEQVQVNQGLLSSLPSTEVEAERMDIPQGIINLCYREGRLDTSRTKGVEWIPTEAPQRFDDLIALQLHFPYANIGETAVALCNLMLDQKDAGQRYAFLKGFKQVEITGVPSVVEGEGPVDLRAEMDNGGWVWLVNLATGERQEINEYLRRELQRYMKSRNLRYLDAAHREELQRIFRFIQVPIGQEVANTLQRRRVIV